MLSNSAMTAFQGTLFDPLPYTTKTNSLYDQIVFTPKEMQVFRYVGFPKFIGLDIGRIYVDKEFYSQGFLVVLEFADGSLYAFEPNELLPVIKEEDKHKTMFLVAKHSKAIK